MCVLLLYVLCLVCITILCYVDYVGGGYVISAMRISVVCKPPAVRFDSNLTVESWPLTCVNTITNSLLYTRASILFICFFLI